MGIDYAKLTVSDIKQMLIDEGRFTEEELNQLVDIKGKSMWVDLHQSNEEWGTIQDDLDNIMVDMAPPKEIEEPDIETQSTPTYDSAEWNDYVMSLFDSDELIDGKYPNVNSLRRLTELLLGEIVFSGPVKVENTMDPEHTGKAVVIYRVDIAWKLGALYDGYVNVADGYPTKSFSSVASSWIGNTDDFYAVFPESIAETRAEGRALRRALRINVVCADELTKKDTAAYVAQQQQSKPTTGEWEEESQITDQQINTIELMCNRLGIDVTKFINSGTKNYKDIQSVTRTAAAGMLKQLNRYQSTGNDALDIPQNLIGE